MKGWTLAAVLAAMPALGIAASHAAGKAPAPLSADATRGFVDIILARAAIFDGRAADARRLVHEAAAAFDKAKDDASVFTMAEGELRASAATPPSPAAQPAAQSPAEAEAEAAAMNRAKQENSAKVWAGGTPDDAAASAANAAAEERAAAAANAAKQEISAKAYASATPIRWLPVEAGMGKDVADAPGQTAALAEADAKLAAGDRAAAMAALRQAGLHLDASVLPLDQTIADLREAAALVDGGKYLEASLLLGHVRDATRRAAVK